MARMNDSDRIEHITATGIRFVGKAAVLASSSAETVSPGRDDDVLYAARFQLRPRLGEGSVINAVLTELGTAITKDWPGAPPLTRDRPVHRRAARFEGVQWDVEGSPGSWMGELLWRHPHRVVSGAPCTTHVLLMENGAHTSMAVRVTADGGVASVRGTVGAGQARPSFLTPLNRTLRMTVDGYDGAARVLSDDVDDFVRDTLLSDDRDYPVAVLAPLEEGGFVVPPAEISDALLGLAHLWVIERHPVTFLLTDALGDRRLSAYWGALRVYMPGFSCADRPEEHPLLVRDRLVDPIMRADLFGFLGRQARKRFTWPAGIRERRAERVASEASQAVDRLEPEFSTGIVGPVEPTGAPPPPTALTMTWPPELLSLGDQVEMLSRTIAGLIAVNESLMAEIGLLRQTTAVRAGGIASLERRIGGLEAALERRLPASAPEAGDSDSSSAADLELVVDRLDPEAPTLADVVRQAAASHADTLLVLESAERSALDSPYEDPDRVAVILDAMATVARQRQEGALGMSLREAFRSLGIDYRGGVSPTTSRRQMEQYEFPGAGGATYQCEEHIALGGTYDPRRCLRIYFTSRAPVEPRFVIGWVGRHFKVLTTT